MGNQNQTTQGEESFGMKFIDPDFVLDQLDIAKGIKAADFGCGTGYFSLAVARRIGDEGIVYALDILPQRLESVASNAKNLNLTNIITKRANLENVGGSKLGDDSMDLVILKDMLFQNKKKKEILQEAGRVAKSGANILVVEWKIADSTIGPERNLRISRDVLLDLVQQANLSVLKDLDAGNFHFGILLGK
jgi:ubiquinone/menaquinone biosynthesis C-methylase UbiE